MHSYLFVAIGYAASLALASPAILGAQQSGNLRTRNIVQEPNDDYDFIIVGGGLAGLVLGGRLSEDSGSSVLVIEAGGDGSGFMDQINIPSNAYWGHIWDKAINWAFEIKPQPGLKGMSIEWPRGKVLGGSSAINGLYLTRPGEIEVDQWQKLLGNMDGAENWSWDSLYASMKKSETFTPASGAVATTGGITNDAASRGTSGPLQASFPGWASPLMGDWIASCKAAGMPAPQDMYGGENWGSQICTSTIDPKTWTRSYSRTGYLDPYVSRTNYDVMVDSLVTKIKFDTSTSPLVATQVEYSPDGGKTLKTVNVKKEVIVAAGSVGSPTVLQHSGIGPKDVLNAANVPVVMELPGVGAHLQDHPSVQTNWKSTIPTAGDQKYTETGAEFFSYVNNAIAYAGSKELFGNGANAVKNTAMSNLAKNAPSDSTVKAGYEAINKANAGAIWDSDLGQVEILMGITNDNSSVNIQVTLQHQYSQGAIYITSNDPSKYPTIDPQYYTNPADVQILTAGLKLARKIANTGPLAGSLTEFSPGTEVQSDEQWANFIAGNTQTEFHPCSTCAMLPQNQGGVVDANLFVYGTSNVRVADASVPPIEFSSHLMGSTYGIAERAADMIKDTHNNPDVSQAKAKFRSSGSGGSSSGASANIQLSTMHIAASLFGIVVYFMFCI